MKNFKPGYDITEEKGTTKEPSIVSLELGKAADVKDYEVKSLARQQSTVPSLVKLSARSQFRASDLVAGAHSLRAREQEEVDKKVQSKLNEISQAAEESGRKIGYEEGLAKGKQEAYEKFMETGREYLERLKTFVVDCDNAKSQIIAENENFIMRVLWHIIKRILLKEVQLDEEYLGRLVKELVQRIHTKENLLVHIHPKDQNSIEYLKSGLGESMEALKNLDVIVDPNMEQGGCRLETKWNSIDATIETQLSSLSEALVGEVIRK